MFQPLSIPSRTIMTPGPVEAEPRILRAMSMPILGQYDPVFLKIMDETMELLRHVFQTKNQWAYPIDGTGRSGFEAILTSIIEPGDKVLVPIFGRFGYLAAEVTERCGAEVHTLEKEWGKVFDPDEIIEAIKKVQPKVVAMVHGETSTGCMQPLEEIGHFCRENNVLLAVDAVATLAGTEVKVDEWCLDAVASGTQKCLSVPTGMSPITYNDRVERVLKERKKIEKGLDLHDFNERRIQSNYFDLSQIQDYWSAPRLNHHTEATTLLYGLREGLRLIYEEGLSERILRHKLHEKALVAGLEAMGLKIFGDKRHKMPMVTCVEVPEGVDGEGVRSMLLNDFGVEIAGAFGTLKGKIWRVGTMGYSCRKANVLHLLGALEATIIRQGGRVNRGEGLQAALEAYDSK